MSGIIVTGRSALAISRSLVASRRPWPAFQTHGRRRHVRPVIAPPPLPSDTAGQSVDVAGGGSVKRRAVAGSPPPWRTCQNADVQRDTGTRSPTGCWVWETTGPPSDAAGWWRSAHLMSALRRLWTVVFLVSYIHCRGKLKRPFLHCWADSVAAVA